MPSPVRFAVVRKLLEAKGYALARIDGSHHTFTKPGVGPVVVPVHHNQVKYGYYRKAQKAPETDLRRPFDARIVRKAENIASRYQITVWREDGRWFGSGVEMPFCMGDGRTVNACLRVTRRSIVLGVATMMEDGQSVPHPLIDQERKTRRKAG